MILSNKVITKALISLEDAQTDLRLSCSQTPEDGFSRVEAHFIITSDKVPTPDLQ